MRQSKTSSKFRNVRWVNRSSRMRGFAVALRQRSSIVQASRRSLLTWIDPTLLGFSIKQEDPACRLFFARQLIHFGVRAQADQQRRGRNPIIFHLFKVTQ